jgi:hypothetical protein
MASVYTNAASNITASGGTFNGEVTGWTAGNVFFNYGYSPSLGHTTSSWTPTGGTYPFNWTISGLAPGTTVYFQAACYSVGTGSIQSFTTATPPSVYAIGSSSIQGAQATLTGQAYWSPAIDTQGAFQWGPTTAYGSTSTGVDIGTSSPAEWSTGITGLTANTLYHWRAIAENSNGTGYSADATFTTTGTAPSATTGSATSVASTSATLNGTVNDNGFAAAGGGATNCGFNLSLSSSGTSPWAVPASPSTFTGSASPTGAATSLSPGTNYWAQMVAWNADGTTYGSWVEFSTPSAPQTPTTTLNSPTNGFPIDLTGTPTFGWTHTPNGGGAETGWAFEASMGGGPIVYWNSTSLIWSATLVVNCGSIASYTFPAGTFAPRVPLSWSVATQDSGGLSAFPTPWTVPTPSAQPAAQPSNLPGTGHVACSDAYLAELATNDLYVAAVAEVWLGGVKLATFQVDPASQGITVDRSQNTRRCAQVVLTEGVAWGPDLQPVRVVPETPQDVFLPYGAEVVLYSGLYFAGGQDQIYDPSTGQYQSGELIQLGVFGINDVVIDHTAPNLVVTLDLFDRAKAVSRAGFIEDTQLPLGVETGAAIQQVYTTVNGGLPTGWPFVSNFANSGHPTPSTAIVWKAGDDPFGQMRSLAQSVGFDHYFDPTGTPCFLPIPNPWSQPISMTFQPGEQNLSTEVARTASRENAPNYVIRIGQDANDNPVQGVSIDQNPLSPTYIGGSYGRQVDCQTSSLITSQTQAQAASDAALLLALGTIEAMDLKAVAGRPDADVDNVEQVTDPVSGIVTASLYVVDSFTLNFGSNAVLEITQARAIASILA